MTATKKPLYSVQPRELPRYTVPEAAHYLSMSKSTLRTWVAGRGYTLAGGGERFWEPLIERPDPEDSRLSFSNLLEAYVLQVLRTEWRVSIPEIRTAIEYTRAEFGVERFLLSHQLRVIPGNIFLEQLEAQALTNVGKGGQEAMREILVPFLNRIRRDKAGLPVQLFPITRTWESDGPEVVTIHPEIAFGRPVVERRWVRTASIAERFKAGESVASLSEDYELEISEIEEAIRYEQPLALAA